MDSYKIVTLANGVEARIRPVSPHVRQGLYLRVEEAVPQKPELPTKTLTSVDGHTEPVPASEGDPEYERWKKDYTAWKAKSDKIEQRINNDNLLRVVPYAVTGWRKQPGPFLRWLRAVIKANWLWRIFGLGWHSTPPKSWQPDPIIRIPDGIDNRGIYILTEVVSTVSDYGLIQYASMPAVQEPITQEEVGRQLDGFPPDS